MSDLPNLAQVEVHGGQVTAPASCASAQIGAMKPGVLSGD